VRESEVASSTRTIGEIATIHAGGRLGLSGLDFVESGYPAYGAAGINGRLATAEYHATDAVILSSVGARCGKCFFASGSWTTLANTQVILPDPNRVDPRFLWYQLNDERRWRRSGSAQPFIKPSSLKSHEVFVPPMSEQRHAVAVLDAADDLIGERTKALDRLAQLKRDLFAASFASDARDGRTVGFDEVFVDATRHSPKLAASRFDGAGRFPIIDQGLHTIAGWTDDETLTTDAGAGVVVFGDHTRRVKFVTSRFVLGADGAKVLKARAHVDPRWAADALAAAHIADLGYSRHMKIVRGLRFPAATIDAQRAYAQRSAAIDAQRARVERGLTVNEELFASLRSRAFSGRL
jgi:hypothetical protein